MKEEQDDIQAEVERRLAALPGPIGPDDYAGVEAEVRAEKLAESGDAEALDELEGRG
ncbi:MAG TPA: hypothetical protein VGL18_04065 [Actinomycetota bacterium]